MKILGITISAIKKNEALDIVEALLCCADDNGKQKIIFTPNPEIILEAQKNRKLFEALECGTLMLPDGHGLQFVSTLMQIKSKFLRGLLYFPSMLAFLFWKSLFVKQIPEIIHGSDFMYKVVEMASQEGQSVFFLGGRNDVAEKTAGFFKKKFSGLKVAGFSELDPDEEALVAVLSARPDVLFVAYGAPKQEEWVCQWKSKLSGMKVIMTVGGSFDFYSENVKRAPKVLRKLGLEWVWRLLKDPVGRAKRIWNAVVIFPIKALFSNTL